MMNIQVLYQDQDITVVEKPSGLIVNKSDTVREETLQDWFLAYLKQTNQKSSNWESLVPADFLSEYGSPVNIFEEREGIVHRLDKDTSGVMILANNPGALVELLRQFRTHEVKKMYTCLTHGKFQIQEDTLTLPLGRSTQNRTKFTIDASGRVAETRYKVVEYYSQLNLEHVFEDLNKNPDQPPERNLRKKMQKTYQGFSLVQCWPKTGRTHQIRVHMSAIKHPIVADATYLGKKRQGLDLSWCPRLFLHASFLELTHPRTKKRIRFESALTPELTQILERYLIPIAQS